MLIAVLTVALADDVCAAWKPPTVVEVKDIPSSESSGVVMVSDEFFTIGDAGGEALLYTFDIQGNYLGEQRIDGATNTDWEDLAAADCPTGTCIFIADIGDNDEARDAITLWKVPVTDDARLAADNCPLIYDDGEAHDAEALLVYPDGSVRVVTKSDTGGKVYYARELSCDGEAATLREEAEIDVGEPITGGTVDRSGALVVLRTATRALAWRGCDVDWGADPQVIDLVGEVQGEAVFVASDGTMYTTSEGDPLELHVFPCASTEEYDCPTCGCDDGAAVPLLLLLGLSRGIRARGTSGRSSRR
ncbi:MAG: hypothetical protein FJ090_10835 [Deltaproteobacteria bacterium]|nr:hypothetical protein [Deltaproteobacteria bacterium]